MILNKPGIGTKTYNQPEIKILFGFKSTISSRFKEEKIPWINSPLKEIH